MLDSLRALFWILAVAVVIGAAFTVGIASAVVFGIALLLIAGAWLAIRWSVQPWLERQWWPY